METYNCSSLTKFYWNRVREFLKEGIMKKRDVMIKTSNPTFERNEEFEKLFYSDRLEKIWNSYYSPFFEEKIEVTTKSEVYFPETSTKCLLSIMNEENHLKFVFRRWELWPAGYFDFCCIDRLTSEINPVDITIYLSLARLFRKGVTPLAFWAEQKGWEIGQRHMNLYEKDLERDIKFKAVKKRVDHIKKLKKEQEKRGDSSL